MVRLMGWVVFAALALHSNAFARPDVKEDTYSPFEDYEIIESTEKHFEAIRQLHNSRGMPLPEDAYQKLFSTRVDKNFIVVTKKDGREYVLGSAYVREKNPKEWVVDSFALANSNQNETIGDDLLMHVREVFVERGLSLSALESPKDSENEILKNFAEYVDAIPTQGNLKQRRGKGQPDKLLVRRILRKDLPAVMRIEKKSFEFPWTLSDFHFNLKHRMVVGYVAEDEENQKVLGYFIQHDLKDGFEIVNFAVDPNYRHLGIGENLISKLKSKLRPKRHTKITAMMRHSNIDAVAFFLAQGFRPQKVMISPFDLDHTDGIVMVHNMGDKPIKLEELAKANHFERLDVSILASDEGIAKQHQLWTLTLQSDPELVKAFDESLEVLTDPMQRQKYILSNRKALQNLAEGALFEIDSPNLYRRLGVSENAGERIFSRARELALVKYGPASGEMLKIDEALEVLRDPILRDWYDATLQTPEENDRLPAAARFLKRRKEPKKEPSKSTAVAPEKETPPMPRKFLNYYEKLGVGENAQPFRIADGYIESNLALAKQSPKETEEFKSQKKELDDAYRVLRDPSLRGQYDQLLRDRPEGYRKMAEDLVRRSQPLTERLRPVVEEIPPINVKPLDGPNPDKIDIFDRLGLPHNSGTGAIIERYKNIAEKHHAESETMNKFRQAYAISTDHDLLTVYREAYDQFLNGKTTEDQFREAQRIIASNIPMGFQAVNPSRSEFGAPDPSSLGLYHRLGVSENASMEKIDEALKHLANMSPQEISRMQAAHAILSDPDFRRNYDEVLSRPNGRQIGNLSVATAELMADLNRRREDIRFDKRQDRRTPLFKFIQACRRRLGLP